MPKQCRVSDISEVNPPDVHGCVACPHPAKGPAIGGSPDVMVNKLPALRVGDPGLHAICCGTNKWTAQLGSTTVLINGKGAHRKDDLDTHCGGIGKMITASPNVESGG